MKRSSRDEGLTLVELLISVSIMVILMAPLSASFLVGVLTSQQGGDEAVSSSDAQLLSSFFDLDVASSEEVSTAASPCSATGPSPALVLALAWREGSSQHHVAYWRSPDTALQARLRLPDPVFTLERVECVDGTRTSSSRVMNQLVRVPEVSCDKVLGCSGVTRPRTVSIVADSHAELLKEAGAPTGRYRYSLTATRRVVP